MRPFTKSRRGVELRVGETEAKILRAMIANLGSVLAEEISDPSLYRLFPPGYEDDAAMQQEFAGLTRHDLLIHKLSAIARATDTLDRAKSKREQVSAMLDDEDQQAWLGVLNDLRLSLGTRLEVTEDTHVEEPDDPRMQVYHYLGWLEENLLQCLLD